MLSQADYNCILAFILAFHLLLKNPKISQRCKPRVFSDLSCACIQPWTYALHSRFPGICWMKPFNAFVFSSPASSFPGFLVCLCLLCPSPLAPVGQYMSLNYFNRHYLGSSSSLERVSKGGKMKANAQANPSGSYQTDQKVQQFFENKVCIALSCSSKSHPKCRLLFPHPPHWAGE